MCAAPIGNQFWKLRSEHGRDMIFSSPEILWEEAVKYFEWCEENPWVQQNWVGKDGDEVQKNHIRPLTLTGLCVFLDISEMTLREYGKRQDFVAVYTRIEQIIRTQKFEGAATGFFNASIIARDLGLVDKVQEDGTKEVTIKVKYERKGTDNNPE